MALLQLKGVTAGYSDLTVLHRIDLTVEAHEAVAVLGPNGAGKTTLLRTISQLTRISEGDIALNGENLRQIPAFRLAHLGIAHVPEGRGIFPSLTVRENLELGANTPPARRDLANQLEEVYHRFPVLRERANSNAGSLSGGQQQMLAIGRALMGKPKLFLLDEPSLGLAPILVRQIFGIVSQIRATGVAVLLVEQNLRLALEIVDRAYVLETGHITLSGTSAELLASPHIKKAYLGL